jgi:hypothetical protein
MLIMLLYMLILLIVSLVYLCFCETESRGDLESLWPREVLVLLELLLQLEQLLAGEGRARTTGLAQ